MMTDLEYHEAVAALARLATDYDLVNEATTRARAARAATALHVFQWERGVVFTVDGVPVPKRAGSRGLALAWLALATHQERMPALEAAWFFPGKHAARRAYQAVQRAAQDVEQVSPSAGAALREIAVQGPCLTLRRPEPVRCAISPDLHHLFRVISA